VPTNQQAAGCFREPHVYPADPERYATTWRREKAAECDSNFLSNASVRGESRTNGCHTRDLTITQIKMTLQLTINIWVPLGKPTCDRT